MRYTILVLVFIVLLTVFSAYAVVYTDSLPTVRNSVQTVGTYSLQGNYTYIAELKPNDVYNTTRLSQGQGVLFVAIVKTIDLTYTGMISLSGPGNVNVGTSYLVALSGGAWNKTLSESLVVAQQSGLAPVIFSKSFELNVTTLSALAKAIGTELQYPTPAYLIQIRPVTSGTLTEGGTTIPVHFVTPLNLTLSGGTITPSAISFEQQGNITNDVQVTYTGTVTDRYASYGLLSGSLILLAGCTYYVLRVEKISTRQHKDELESKTRPYMEVIAATTTPPQGNTPIAMTKWEDLVKVADALGKPILEYTENEQQSTKHVFWVSDGELTYTYQHISKPDWAV